MFENVDGRTTDGRTTDAGVTGILIAHLGAFGSGELIRSSLLLYEKLINRKCLLFLSIFNMFNLHNFIQFPCANILQD